MTKAQHQEFLEPLCTSQSLDRYGVRSSILRHLNEVLHRFSGKLLDVGCGYMPYKPLVTAAPSQVKEYVGLDLASNAYQKPDLEWDGRRIPIESCEIDCAMATELFEHCPDPELVMREVARVLKPGGVLFLTVPFLWPLHCVPHDEYRYTPFSLARHLQGAGFTQIQLRPLGGWDASLAQIIGLWVRRRPMSERKRAVLSRLATPVVRFLLSRDKADHEFGESCMITGLSGTAVKASR